MAITIRCNILVKYAKIGVQNLKEVVQNNSLEQQYNIMLPDIMKALEDLERLGSRQIGFYNRPFIGMNCALTLGCTQNCPHCKAKSLLKNLVMDRGDTILPKPSKDEAIPIWHKILPLLGGLQNPNHKPYLMINPMSELMFNGYDQYKATTWLLAVHTIMSIPLYNDSCKWFIVARNHKQTIEFARKHRHYFDNMGLYLSAHGYEVKATKEDYDFWQSLPRRGLNFAPAREASMDEYEHLMKGCERIVISGDLSKRAGFDYPISMVRRARMCCSSVSVYETCEHKRKRNTIRRIGMNNKPNDEQQTTEPTSVSGKKEKTFLPNDVRAKAFYLHVKIGLTREQIEKHLGCEINAQAFSHIIYSGINGAVKYLRDPFWVRTYRSQIEDQIRKEYDERITALAKAASETPHIKGMIRKSHTKPAAQFKKLFNEDLPNMIKEQLV